MSKDVVRTGYDIVAAEYLAARHLDTNQFSFLEDFAGRVPRGARVLDAGCGAGIPVTRWLSERYTVTGVDISEEQIRRARQSVPEAAFIRQDMTALDFPDQSFDAICSFYAVIHIPREEHRPVLENFHRMLKPRGILLLCTGAGDAPGDIDEFFGAPMYWSHYDAETNLRMTEDAGFAILRSELVPDKLEPRDEPGLQNSSNHLFLLAEKREHAAR
jgi:SAM-dependent methyltransferase